MSDSRQKLAAHATSGRADLDLLLRARERGEIARLMRRLRRWHRELLPLAKAHDPTMVPYLEILRPEPEELRRIWRWLNDLPSAYQRGLCNAIEAALVRVNNDLMRQPDRGPKRPGRKKGQKLYEDKKAIAKARKLLAEPDPPSPLQAAKDVEPLADKGQSREANIARIYKALRDL